MKILVISDYRNELSSRPEAEMFLAIAALPGFTVHVMTFPEGVYVQKFRERGIAVIPFHPRSKWLPGEAARIRLQLREGHYDILHLFNSKALMQGIRAAKGLPVKLIAYRGFLGHVHWYDPLAYLKYLHPRLDVTVCITREIQQDLNRQYLWRRPATEWIPKGHHPAWYNDVRAVDLSTFGVPEGSFTVICVANNRPFKDIPMMLRAAALVPLKWNVYWLLVGHGMSTRINTQLARKIGDGTRVHFLGFRRDSLQLMKASQVVALSSRSGEGLNKTVMEGQFLGLPAVVTDLGGNREIVDHGKGGFIVPVGDAQAFADAIVRLASNQDLYASMARQAPDRVSHRLHIDESVRGMIALYERLVRTR